MLTRRPPRVFYHVTQNQYEPLFGISEKILLLNKILYTGSH